VYVCVRVCARSRVCLSCEYEDGYNFLISVSSYLKYITFSYRVDSIAVNR